MIPEPFWEVPMLMPDGLTVTIHKSPPDDLYTWAFIGKIRGNAYSFRFYIDQYPTYNCQVTSVGHMDYIFDGTDTRTQALGALCEGYRLAGIKPKLILMDVAKEYMGKMDMFFANHIVMKNPYESTNDTKMCLYMVTMPSA